MTTEGADNGLKVLIIGSGGREHALAFALTEDPGVDQVHVAPGNPGMTAVAELHAVDMMDGDAVAALATQLGADLVVIGPEAPLVAGVADTVRGEGIACFGPSAEAAQLEGSKAFAKEIMEAAGVPTARSRTCTTPDEAAAALDEFGAPYVVKDDGLAGGKGVVVTSDRDEALAHAASCARVVIEEFLDGPEVSLFAITDGTTVRAFQPAQDFKRVGDGDTGPNTGGMGAYTPLPWAPADLSEQVVEHVIQPTVDELRRRGTPFVGLVYAGLALTSKGVKVIEFNARFGDPETQPLLMLLASPLGQTLYAAATGTLAEQPELKFHPGAAVGVVLCSDGYPEAPQKGTRVAENQFRSGNIRFIHSGTSRDELGNLVINGGRVLTVTGRGHNLKFARNMVYSAVGSIDIRKVFWRRDIAQRAADGTVEWTEPKEGLFQ
ncbi:phosphoribosylamine--glycine ligase [Mariniluteicoccus flavus]